LLDLPNHTMWVLKGAYRDQSLMRDALAFEIGRRTGEYSPRTRFVELYINGASRGVYVMTDAWKTFFDIHVKYRNLLRDRWRWVWSRLWKKKLRVVPTVWPSARRIT